MSVATCPRGHASTTDDFCDTCGAKIAGVPSAPSSSSPTAPSSVAPSSPPAAPASSSAPSPSPPSPSSSLSHLSVPAAASCPHCGAPRAGTGRFCEDCGFDHETGKVPVLGPPPTTAPAGWTATVAADRAYFEDNAIEGVDFPASATPRTVDLPSPQVRIGRRSTSKGTHPELDLADFDPGVSHSHALLTLSVDGVWLLSDLGSTNGTWLNDEPKPLTAGETRPLTDGDRVHVGAWTTITVHAPTA